MYKFYRDVDSSHTHTTHLLLQTAHFIVHTTRYTLRTDRFNLHTAHCTLHTTLLVAMHTLYIHTNKKYFVFCLYCLNFFRFCFVNKENMILKNIYILVISLKYRRKTRKILLNARKDPKNLNL